MHWNRKQWGVEAEYEKGKPVLIGTGWHSAHPAQYVGEPTRCLLFTTRSAAREWCKAKMATYTGRSDCCAEWKFRPVRVIESVRKVK